MTADAPAYGLWFLVVINAAVFILFAFSFFKPRTKRDWRSFGAYSAFIVALFVEMYGFPLTLYLLAGWFGTRFPALDPMSHDSGHLWPALLGWPGDPHFSPFHFASYVLIGGGFILIASAWRVLYAAQRAGQLATTGPYARIRHPQYAGFALILIGFFLQWPTLITGLMLPVLLVMYWRLALIEERDAQAAFGDAWRQYAREVPPFVPWPGHSTHPSAQRGTGEVHSHDEKA
jgi:protein-S-isoprenylcysteine O-methyltransferase Ste14